MKAWILEAPGGALSLKDVPVPDVTPGSVLVDVKAVPLLGYTRKYVDGVMPYWYPSRPFTIGTNGIGVVRAVGDGVYHVKPGQRALVQPYLVANEPVADPAQILMGLTGMSADSGKMLEDWADGTLSETARVPASTVLGLPDMDRFGDDQLAGLGKFVVSMGGLRRGALAAGQTLIVHGATGYFGSAAVMVGLALGAERVVAAGRTTSALDALARALGPRVIPVTMAGDPQTDATALRQAAGGGAHLAFDMVGGADSADGTLAALKALRRNGKLVLMGSMTVPLPIPYGEVLANNWEVIGHFMYTPEDYRTLLSLVRSGSMDLDKLNTSVFDLADLDDAMTAAEKMRGLDSVVVAVSRPGG